MRLAPSVLSFDLTQAATFLPQYEQVGAEVVHLDIMDGQFVPPITFGDAIVKSFRKYSDLPFEAHLMTLTPEAHFEPFIDAGCSRILFHVEVTPHAHRLVHKLKNLGVEAGLVINPGTPVEAILPMLHDIDQLLIMTVNPGWGGQPFIPSTLEKVQRVRALRPDLTIEVDGGVDPKTIGSIVKAGADLFVVGSYLAKAAHMADAVAALEAACEA